VTRSPETWQGSITPEAADRLPQLQLGQRFQVFPQASTEPIPRLPGWGYEAVPKYEAKAVLRVEELAPLPITFSALPTWKDRTQAFAPFAPALGYHITVEDFDPTTRAEKLAAMVAAGMSDIPGNSLELGAGIPKEEAIRLGLQEPHPTLDCTRYTPEAFEVLAALRFQLFFPGGIGLEAAPDPHQLAVGEVSFMDGFYPFDFGPLPIPRGYRHLLSEGLQVAVPSEPNVLQQIKARFVLR
jgi:hypothetical protein